MKRSFKTREEWLQKATDELRPWFALKGTKIPPKVQIAMGFPSTGRRGKRIGEAWDKAAHGVGTIYIHPNQTDPIRILGILIHELVHLAVGLEHGHKAPFRRLAVGLGLEGKMTATSESKALVKRLTKYIIPKLGELPHSGLAAGQSTHKKQTCRQRKYLCPDCGQIIRAASDDLMVICDPCGSLFDGPQ